MGEMCGPLVFLSSRDDLQATRMGILCGMIVWILQLKLASSNKWFCFYYNVLGEIKLRDV